MYPPAGRGAGSASQTADTGDWVQVVQISSAEAALQLTYASPTVAVAPKETGTATQMSWLMVKTQEPFLAPAQVFPCITTGSPQHRVTACPV